MQNIFASTRHVNLAREAYVIRKLKYSVAFRIRLTRTALQECDEIVTVVQITEADNRDSQP